MKKFLLTSISIFLFIQLVQSQNFINEFGKCSNDEFQMGGYSKDSLAEAVVIYDIGRSHFKMAETGMELIFEKKIKIKIFNKAGIKVAKFSIPYYEQNFKPETILELEGNTYNLENGTIRTTSFDRKNAYEEKKDNKWKILKFAMPDVKEGSVIEVRYVISSPYFFNFRDWSFQYSIPVIYSEYKAQMIPFYEYRFILQGTDKLSETKKYKDNTSRQLAGNVWEDMVYVFIMKDVPAFRDESFISAPDDYKIQIKFQLSKYTNSLDAKQELLSTWPKLIKDMLDEQYFGDYAKKCSEASKKYC